jgi:tRNA(Ile)-lysidine synthase
MLASALFHAMIHGKRGGCVRRPEALKKIERQLMEHLENCPWLHPGMKVGVGVSGGADSVALLRLLVELRAERGLLLAVVHFNHQLRGKTSDADERFVARLAKSHELEFIAGREDVAARTKRERGNLEDMGRRVRYAFFDKLRETGRIERVAVAHTADDQAETVLAHILRGTGLSGLRGIHPQAGTVIRPLLGVRRAQLRMYLKTLKQAWREDATNKDTKRMRARIRQRLLPILEKDFNSGVVEHLCQLAELARDDEDFLEARAAEWIQHFAEQKAGTVTLQLGDLLPAPKALQTRIVRGTVGRLKTRGGQLSKEHVAAAIELASQRDSGKTLQLPGGVEVRREREVLRFRAAQTSPEFSREITQRNYAYKIDLRGGRAELRLVELSCLLHFREIDWPAEGRETSGTGAVLDRSRLRTPLILRNWRPGDAMRPIGHEREHSLARLLNELQVSRWDKATWPVLTSGEQLVWTRGLRESAEFAVGPETREAVLIVEEPLP